ncbi:hypothetical protein PPYR_11011 [Photinus pyralis]|uniref:Cell growth-regulating nucleolar protein-like winged helix domain-containing protein n=1 Tax=Photinus pyralis TaxID=7054 RepID=A0A5N4AHW3_PHOPY|nr:uncharacterized protein LOC116174319 [Photinus pyralis]KAB0796950.1 hypothetical protein PPYR_11011 [Photinus pyralis]
MGNKKKGGKKQKKGETTQPEELKITPTYTKQKKRDFDEQSNAESVNMGETQGKNRKKSKLQQEETVTSTTMGQEKRTLANDINSYEFKRAKTSDPTEEIDTHKKPDHAKKTKKSVKTKSKGTNTKETQVPHTARALQLTNLIKLCLKEDEKTISIAKLQKKVLKKYCQMKGGQETPKLVREFNHCLYSTQGVEVVNDTVKLLTD